MKNQEIIDDLISALVLNDRKDLIRAIKEYSSEEFENLENLWALASLNKHQLRYSIINIINYYKNEE